MQVVILILMVKSKMLRFIIGLSQTRKFLKIIKLFQVELAYKMMAYHNMVIKEIKYKDLPSQFCIFKDAIAPECVLSNIGKAISVIPSTVSLLDCS